jgi:hypothetical protein
MDAAKENNLVMPDGTPVKSQSRDRVERLSALKQRIRWGAVAALGWVTAITALFANIQPIWRVVQPPSVAIGEPTVSGVTGYFVSLETKSGRTFSNIEYVSATDWTEHLDDPIDWYSLKMTCDVTNTGKRPARLTSLYVDVREYEKIVNTGESYQYGGISEIKKFRVLLSPTPGRYVGIPDDGDTDKVIVIQPNEMETLQLRVRAPTEGLYRISFGVGFSSDGTTIEKVIGDGSFWIYFTKK